MPEQMIEVQIDSVRVHLMTPQRLVVLKQMDSERYLPIWVGPYEAEAITVALQEVEMVRPLTHDLLKNVFGAFNARITRIEIVKLQNEIFYGSIIAELNGKEIHGARARSPCPGTLRSPWDGAGSPPACPRRCARRSPGP